VSAQRSTRAHLRSANPSGSAPRSICATWPGSPALFAGDRRATPITSASHNREDLGSRSVTNLPSRSVPSTISRIMRLAMSDHGGTSTRLIPSLWLHVSGEKVSACRRRRTNNPSTTAGSEDDVRRKAPGLKPRWDTFTHDDIVSPRKANPGLPAMSGP